ncbi:interleukin-15 receptor subunit alpha [Trichechus manatus latirostris]|uniref:Interleukin-15 receptor subunit alpha n=1 Tax=Trichechus manatus latirostris TaxID=127582 RepID=A0A2Y9R6E7_TRIMA|nr:interleukin-15 receptor subunit alpha [Trichechus manatus latirostris]
MSVEHADIRVKNYNLSSRERYTCNSGFKRKAGTSSLTECVLNKTTNTAHWTTPNLKCIRDPSLTHQMPVSSSTLAPAKVIPQPESFTPSRKDASSDNSTAVTGSFSAVTVAVSTSVLLLTAVGVLLFCLCYKKTRQYPPTPNVEMDNIEDMPMTAETSNRQEDTEDYQYNL